MFTTLWERMNTAEGCPVVDNNVPLGEETAASEMDDTLWMRDARRRMGIPPARLLQLCVWLVNLEAPPAPSTSRVSLRASTLASGSFCSDSSSSSAFKVTAAAAASLEYNLDPSALHRRFARRHVVGLAQKVLKVRIPNRLTDREAAGQKRVSDVEKATRAIAVVAGRVSGHHHHHNQQTLAGGCVADGPL